MQIVLNRFAQFKGMEHSICFVTFFFILSFNYQAHGREVKTGVGVFDTLFIDKNASLNISGDLYLNSARVRGEGILRLRGKGMQKIVTRHSQVANLELVPADEVSLSGELLVSQSLTIKTGIFNTNRGDLQISDTVVLLLQGGSIDFYPTKMAGLPVSGNKLNPYPAFYAVLPVSDEISVHEQRKESFLNKETARCYSDISQFAESTPPERM